MAPLRRNLIRSNARTARPTHMRKAFRTSRLNEPQLASTDPPDLSEHESEVETTHSDSSEDNEPSRINANSYNALLQSLNAETSTDRPLRKKRKPNIEPAEDDVKSTELNTFEEIARDEANGQLDRPVEPGETEAQDDAEDADADSDEEGRRKVQLKIPTLISGVLDPFQTHFDSLDGDEVKGIIKGLENCSSKPYAEVQSRWKFKLEASRPDKFTYIKGLAFPAVSLSAQDLYVKEKLHNGAQELLSTAAQGITGSLARAIFSYQDVFFCGRSLENGEALQNLACLHVINHVFKTRTRILKNTTRLSKADVAEDVEYRDQGFTRPKVLVLLPTRQSCFRFVQAIISLVKSEQVENLKRFTDTYNGDSNDVSEDKPLDFRDLFGGNDDDLFRLGIKFTRKTIKLFAPFYTSDIILASPLGLRMTIGAEDSKSQDSDFLSSIEIAVIERAEALVEQNQEHINFIFERLNMYPKKLMNETDFSRVRSWYLDGNARCVRQNLVFSAYNTPEIHQLVRYMLNIAGRLKVAPSDFDGALVELGISVKQTFIRFHASEPQADPDSRFKYFQNTIIPNLTKFSKSGRSASTIQGTLIFIPSYMDFVRVRNFLAMSPVAQNISFGSISEYDSPPNIARTRSLFLSGRYSLVLYSGRAHWYRRYTLRGVKHVIFYSLPDNPLFYKELVGDFLARSASAGHLDPSDATVRSMFSKFDRLKLERIVGTKRLWTMLKENSGDTFHFL